MCESNVYFKRQGKEELVMKDVAAIEPLSETRFMLKGLLGERKEIHGKIESIDLMAHRILFKESE